MSIYIDGTLTCSISEFEYRCMVRIEQEQQQTNPDNHLISILCDSVRLAREYTQASALALEAAADEWHMWTENTLRAKALQLRESAPEVKS